MWGHGSINAAPLSEPSYKYSIVADFRKVATITANSDRCLHLMNQATYFEAMASPDLNLFSQYSANEKYYKANPARYTHPITQIF